jgi:hypothetical protein
MMCDEVRDQLAEHLLRTLEPPVDLQIRRHLRGCVGCRSEMGALADGVSTLALAAHDVAPPPELRERVLSVLDDEWTDRVVAEARPNQPWWARRVLWIATAAALVAALAWGGLATGRAARWEEEAGRYRALLGALGGEDVRVGTLSPAGSRAITGSVVVYDSNVGQSWVLVLVRAPGMRGSAELSLSSDGHTIRLHPLRFAAGGEASSWLVTSADLSSFDHLEIWDDGGRLASSDVSTR